MPQTHVVVDGECIESIASRYGFHPQTLWAHAENETLRGERANPHELVPGDEVRIPDREVKSLGIATGRRHTFRRRGVPAKIRVRLEDEGEPRAAVSYTLQLDNGAVIAGTADADGHLEEWIAPDARRATLTLESGETYTLRLGALRPNDFRKGVVARLHNLGYAIDDDDDTLLEAALLQFQHDEELEETGDLDEATLTRLAELHRS